MDHTDTQGRSELIARTGTGAIRGSMLRQTHPQLDLDCSATQKLHGIGLQVNEDGVHEDHNWEDAHRIQLQTDRPRQTLRSYTSVRARLHDRLPTALAKQLRNRAREQHVSIFSVLLSGLAVLLGRWSGQEEVYLATSTFPYWGSNVGPRIGRVEVPITLELNVKPDRTVGQLLKYTEFVLKEAYARSAVAKEQGSVSLSSSRLGMSPQILADFNDTYTAPTNRLDPVPEDAAGAELALSFSDVDGHIRLVLEYEAALFDKETIERMIGRWKKLLYGMVKHVSRPIDRLGDMTAAEREQVLHRFNATASHFPQHRLIHELFEEQAERTPTTVAVEYEKQSLTYAELNSRANQVAKCLLDVGVDADQLVAICADRSPELVVGILGILKAGAAYVPLDPNYPADRLEYMLQDAAPTAVLTQSAIMSRLSPTSATVIDLGEVREIGEKSARKPTAGGGRVSALNRVYVIYTSGSTGRPKGIEMAHGSMINLIEWHRRSFSVNENKRVLQFAALSFDVAFQEIFTTLCTGGTLVLLEEWVRHDAGALMQLLCARSIERLFVPPLVLQNLAEFSNRTGNVASSLHDVIVAGEQLRVNPEISEFFRRHRHCKLHNHYGPTETHVVTAMTLDGNPDDWPMLPPIGRPIANTQIYVLDGQQQPVPIGATGEIYIGGANVALGYLNRPELTTQRFLEDPFSPNSRARLYRTGDLGCWRANGTLEFFGRNDDQVKIRGFRVELGEIEGQLARYDRVKDVAVVTREDVSGDKRLVAYITARDSARPSAEDLRAYLKTVLPEHMVPSAFIVLETLPLTPNGKLDRQALPAPSLEAYVNRHYEAPQGEAEELLAGIWRDLLKTDRVGRLDNFFELGGHSLLVARMIERLHRVGLSTAVHRYFQSTNLAALASSLTCKPMVVEAAPTSAIPENCEVITTDMLPLVNLDETSIRRITEVVPGGARNIQDIYPLAPLQQGLLFHHLFDEQSANAYVLVMLVSLPSWKMVDQFIQAFQATIDRHDVLRTAVLWEGLPRPVQVVYRSVSMPIQEASLDPKRDPVEQLKERMREHQRIELRRAPMLRFEVAENMRGPEAYVLLRVHHLVCDAESLETLLGEVSVFIEGRVNTLSSSVPYRNHVAQALAHSESPETEVFFRGKLMKVDEPTAPFGLLDVYGDGTEIDEASRKLDADLARDICTLARHLHVGPAVLFHAAWGLVISRLSGRDDVVFGTVLSGRTHGSPDAAHAVGMLINTLPLRLQLEHLTTQQLVAHTQRELAELLDHEQASLAVAQRCSGVSPSVPLFSSLFNYAHNASQAVSGAPLHSGIQLLGIRERTNYPISMLVSGAGGAFVLTAKADRRINPERLIDYLSVSIRSLVEAMGKEPETPALTLQILPTAEHDRVTCGFNATEAAYSRDKLIHELFEEQVLRSPGDTAVKYEEQLLSYKELNSSANQLARHLRKYGVGPDRRVALYLDRSPEMLIALLGILKAGGAYVPLDPSNPAERLRHILEDAAPLAIVTHSKLIGSLPRTSASAILVDLDWTAVAMQSTENLDPNSLGLKAHHLAYVIYTSGSTGTPKGVMVEHRNIVNYSIYAARQFDVSAGNGSLICTSISFDLMLTGLYPTLLSGRTVRLCSQQQGLPTLVDDVLRCANLAPLKLTPSHLRLLQAELERGQLVDRVRTLVLGGEPLTADAIALWRRHAPTTRIFNHYGPTETTVGCVAGEALDLASSAIPLGRPISNTKVYILDRHLQPVPIGVVGEIHVAGAGVARGYLNRPELTAARFINDPFSQDSGARMYKTGDLGRWHENGTIEYLARNDDQVKIRGFRVEPSEIAAQLRTHPWIMDVAVVAREDLTGAKYLVAYVTPRVGVESADFSADVLRSYLRGTLPDYMIPAAFVVLSHLPLTQNGKLDRNALPAPDFGRGGQRSYDPPRGETEEIITGIWKELLRTECIGRSDNFFERGGHSLLAMQVVVRLQAMLPIRLPMRALFEHPTVEQLAARVDELNHEHLVEQLNGGDRELEDLLKQVTSIPDNEVQRLLSELN